MPLSARFLVVVAALAASIGLLVDGRWLPASVRQGSSRAYPISEVVSKDVFGYGDGLGVTVSAASEARFRFKYEASNPVAYYVWFEPVLVQRADEVELALNGVRIGHVNPSKDDRRPRSQQVKLPREHLKPGVENELVFRRTAGAPPLGRWAVARPRLVIRPLPACAKDECLTEAKKLFDLAEQTLTQQPSLTSRAKASQQLQMALLYLEVLDPKPALYGLVQAKLKETDREYDEPLRPERRIESPPTRPGDAERVRRLHSPVRRKHFKLEEGP
jgi:hypothetical protein